MRNPAYSNSMIPYHTPCLLSCLLSTQRQRLINSANGVSSKPLQNGRHENIENGNVPVENPEDPQQNQEQQPPPQPPPPEPEPVEAAFLSPFSMPGMFWECWTLRLLFGGSIGTKPRSSAWRHGPVRAAQGWCKGSLLGRWNA